MQNLRQIGHISIQPTVGASKHMVASMVNIQHQVVTHKLQTKHSKGVTVNCFLPLERSATRFAISNFLLCARQVKVACTTVVTKFVRQLQPLLQRPHSTVDTGLHSELWCSFTQPSSACTFVFVGQVQLLSLWFSRQNIGNDIQRSTAVHYLYGQFSQPL